MGRISIYNRKCKDRRGKWKERQFRKEENEGRNRKEELEREGRNGEKNF